MSDPSILQIKHFWKLVDEGKITKANLQRYLENPDKFVISFPTIVDNTLGLTLLVQKAVGPNNLQNINPNITSERFKLGDGVRKVNLELAPFLDDETGEQAAKRLVAEGYVLEGTGELAQFLADNPKEVEKYVWVVALSEASRWTNSNGYGRVSYACVNGAYRHFNLYWFGNRFNSDYRALVSRPSK